jgi:hypothetical protein
MNFLFPRQIQRVSYLLRLLTSIVPCVLLGLLIGYLGYTHPQLLQSSLTRPLLWLFTIGWYAYLLCFIVAPRFLDIGLPRVCVVFALILGVNLVLGLMALFAPTGWWLRRTMNYQFVLQFRGDSREDLEATIALEDELIEELGDSADVDGHDVGSGETNIFIFTSDPATTFRLTKPVLERRQQLRSVTAAYRKVNGEHFTVIWPEGSGEEFRVT